MRCADSALILAAFGGYKDVCQVLLAAGIDKNYKGNCGLSAAEWATSQGHNEVAKLIKNWVPVRFSSSVSLTLINAGSQSPISRRQRRGG